MNLPNNLTISRIILAPIFFILMFSPTWFGAPVLPVFIAMLVIFLYMEVSDIADGFIARKYNLVTDLGKVLDPFSDVICRVSYFLGFVVLGIMPAVVFLIILYREIGIVFVRMVLAQRGIALAARKGGKFKSLLYFFSSLLGVLYLGQLWLGMFIGMGLTAQMIDGYRVGLVVLFWVSAGFALGSFVDYLIIFFRHLRQES